jgi:biopolymer transport protein ExbB/TolQ
MRRRASLIQGQRRELGGGDPGSWPRGSINVDDEDADDDVDDRAMIMMMMMIVVMMMIMMMIMMLMVMATIVIGVDPLPHVSVVAAGGRATERAITRLWKGSTTG